MPAILDSFTGIANTISTLIEVEGGVKSHTVAGKGYVNTENSQIASADTIFTPYITKVAKSMATLTS